jgi:hypothetical protein
MKIEDLFEKNLQEMPMLINKELDDGEEFSPFFITDENIKKQDYKLLNRDGNVVVYMSQNNSALVGFEAARKDGVEGVNIVGQVIFKDHLDINSDNEFFHQNKNILQIDLVNVAKQTKLKGLGTFLYASLIKSGYIIISDTKQYLGGQALWKKLARSSGALNALVLIMTDGILHTEDEKPIIYDGKNIPDKDLWSETAEKRHTLLLFTSKSNVKL